MAVKGKQTEAKKIPQTPKWNTCESVVGFRYVMGRETAATCEKKARTNNLCDTHARA